MDILALIDRLDDLLHDARPVPLSDKVRVDREEIYDILDQMRATLPEEIAQARRLLAGGGPVTESLERLARLREAGALTDAEFEAAKAKVLAQ